MIPDIRHALRALTKYPGFTAIAVVTLALGIGATAAIFSVVNGVLVRPLGFADPGQLVQLLGYRVGEGVDRGTISYPNFADWRAQSASFAAMSAYDEWQATLVGTGDPERLVGASVNASFFSLLGVRPAIGRFFRDDEDVPGEARVVVLGHGLWRRRFGGDPFIVGTTLTLSGTVYTVVGVAAADFEEPLLSGIGEEPELWRVTPGYFDAIGGFRSGRSFAAIGRLREDVSLATAQAELDAIMARLAEAYPEANADRGVLLEPLRERIVGPVRYALLVLFASVSLVLLIAAANVANLLLGRGVTRARELAVRASLGASRWRLVRLLLVESVVLAVVGGAVGLGAALLGTDALLAMGAAELPRAAAIGFDWRVLAFTAGVSVLTGVVFGTVPALRLSAVDLHGALKRGGAGGTVGGQSRSRQLLVGVEVALALTLLASAALLIRSLHRLSRVDPGLEAAGVLTLALDPPAATYPEHDDVTRLYDRILPALAALPGVETVAAVNILPLGGSFNGMGFTRDDRPPPPSGEGSSAETRTVAGPYFQVLRIPLLRGRTFDGGDDESGPPVVVINQAMAERFFPGEDPVGKRLTRSDVSREIVGVVGNVHQFGLDLAPRPTMYTPHRQELSEWLRLDLTVVMRGEGDLLRLAPAARAAVWSIDGAVPVTDVRAMPDVVGATLAGPRFRTTLLGLFAALALALGAVGIFGVVASSVGRRRRELGIRASLGASADRIVGLVLREGLRPVAIGVAVGLLGTLAVGRALATLLFDVAPFDPVSFVAVAALLGAVATVACYLPARRAARVDPMEALRSE